MLPIHFALLEQLFNDNGYNFKILKNKGPGIVEAGLKYVHNDTCYPALLVIGQMIDALNSGKYDINKTALLITQTGGGCRASNYIHLLRKALSKAGYAHVPVISLNLSGMEKNAGFKFTIPLLRKSVATMAYGDMLMLLKNQVKPYETEQGATDKLVKRWQVKLCEDFKGGKGLSLADMKVNFKAIVLDFAGIKTKKTDKIKVGIVGEIYIRQPLITKVYPFYIAFLTVSGKNHGKIFGKRNKSPIIRPLILFLGDIFPKRADLSLGKLTSL